MAVTGTSLFQGLYLGEYDHALDAQCRVTLPSDWRNPEGATELVMIPARGKALVLLPIQTFLDFVKKATKLAIANPKMQMALAYLGSRSRQCRCDKQGRIALDRKMLDEIEVKNQLKLIGAVTHIRLSAPENWQSPDDEGTLNMYLDEIQKVSDEGDGIASLLADAINKKDRL